MCKWLSRWIVVPAVLSVLCLSGCGGVEGQSTSGDESPAGDDPPVPVAPVDTADPAMKPSELRRKLGIGEQGEIMTRRGRITRVSLAKTSVADLEPLAGLPIEWLYLERTPVEDLSPLKDLPLQRLWLNHTPVEDISPLAGMKLDQLNLFGTEVEDIEPVRTMELGTLWLRETEVSDLSPLKGRSLVSLDIQETPVADLSPLEDMTSLRRLNMAGTAVTDLTPLKGLRLQRLIFTPSRIERGLEVVRNMDSLQELDVTFREPERLSPAEFWKRYEAGELQGE